MGHERMDLGARGESVVADHLVANGWQVVVRNWRCAVGEVDLVAVDPDGVAVVCEVKTRSGTGFGGPLEAITYAKASRLRRLAAEWARVQDHPVVALRVDAFGVVIARDGTVDIEHVRGIDS